MKTLLKPLSLAGLLAFSSTLTHASTLIDVNLTSGGVFYSGAAAVGASGDTWNNINSSGSGNFTTSLSDNNTYNGTTLGTSASLVDSTGAATGAILTTAGFYTATNGYGTSQNFAANLFANGIGAWGQAATPSVDTSATLTFANLAGNTTYQLELYTSNASVGRSVTFTTNLGQATALDQTSTDSFDIGENYVVVEGKTDGAGTLIITATAASENNSSPIASQGFIDIMGVQLSDVAVTPEPSTWAMMIIGLVSLIGLRRFIRRA